MEQALHSLSWLLLLSGGVFCIIGSIGLLRMPDAYTRMHAASIIDTLGLGCILTGLMLQSGFTLITTKLAIVMILVFFTSPVATHAMARAMLHRGIKPILADKQDRSSNS